MYLWKYWRESRITFAVGLLLVGLLLWGVLKIPVGSLMQGPHDAGDSPATIYLLMAAPLVLPLGFLALLFGSFGIGSDMGKGSGSFLFSRPRTRAIFCLHSTAGLLLIGLLFGLTYFCSVLAKNRGVLLAIGIVVAYQIAKAVVKYKWPSITLPDLTLTEFSMTPQGPPGFAKNLGLEIGLRSAVALAFPFAAQLLLQQRDID